MKQAFAAGVNLFDNAEAYAKGDAERIMGDAVRRGVADGVWAREDLVLTTKLFFGTRAGANAKGLSRKHVLEGAAASVARLGLAYVDVIFAHRPDPVTPVEETVAALAGFVRDGRVRYTGWSNLTGWQVVKVVAESKRLGLAPPLALQEQYSLLCRATEWEVAEACAAEGVALLPWSPLKGGWLSGKMARDAPPPEGSRVAVQEAKGASRGPSAALRCPAVKVEKAMANSTAATVAPSWCMGGGAGGGTPKEG
jgi:aryl-alcohol dehydrogenase-like predicted oxidoreductase